MQQHVDFLISFRTGRLSKDKREALWRILVRHAVEIRKADSFSIEEGFSSARPPSEFILARDALRRRMDSSAKHRREGWAHDAYFLDDEILQWLIMLGPHVVSVNIFHGDLSTAMVCDWGDAFAATATADQWEDLRDQIERALQALPPLDMAELESR